MLIQWRVVRWGNCEILITLLSGKSAYNILKGKLVFLQRMISLSCRALTYMYIY